MAKQTTKNKVYIFHSDPGHGWLAVKRSELKAFGIEDKISAYSYQKGATVYLEEDCDAPTFVDALKASGKTFEYRSSFQEKTPIRSYSSYLATVLA